MIIRSTKLDLTTEPFLLVLLKRVLWAVGIITHNAYYEDG